MTEYRDMSLDELNQLSRKLSKDISKLSEEMTATGSEAKMDEYRGLHNKRSQVDKVIEGYGRYEHLHGHKRPLPKVPEKILTSDYYFNKKKELEAREQEFEQEHNKAVAVVEGLSEVYKDAVLHGTQEEIEQLYNDLEQFERAVKIAKSKMETLANAKDRALDDTAMQIYLSHSDIKRDHKAVNDFLKVAQDRGDKSGMGTGLKIRYKPA